MIGLRCHSMTGMTMPITERLFAKRQITEDGCWLFTGYCDPKWGYAMMSVAGKKRLVHRIAYEEFVGPIPAGLTIDRLCRRPSCFNPEHLEPVTQGENNERGRIYDRLRDRTACPKGHPYSHTITSGGYRERRCRECHRDAQRRYLARRADS